MAQKTFAWEQGSGSLTLDYTGQGDGTVTVTSDANDTSTERSMTLSIKTEDGSVARQLTVRQARMRQVVEREATLTVNVAAHDGEDYSYYSLTNPSNGYAAANNFRGFAQIRLKNGSNAATWVYWTFDLSSIPDNAKIVSVSCQARCSISNTSATYSPTRNVQLFAGETAKGSPSTVSSTSIMTLDAGEWTLDELRNLRLRTYAKRGTSSTSYNVQLRFYGATLTVNYTYQEEV